MLIAVALLASLHFLHLFSLIKSEVFSYWERLIVHHCGGRVVQSEGGVFSNRLPRCADIDQSADYLHINGQESKEAPVGVSARWLANNQMEAWCHSSRDDLHTIRWKILLNCLLYLFFLFFLMSHPGIYRCSLFNRFGISGQFNTNLTQRILI